MFGYITDVSPEHIPNDAWKFFIDNAGEVFFFSPQSGAPSATPAAIVNISKRPKFYVPRSAMLDGFDNPPLITLAPGTSSIPWDYPMEPAPPRSPAVTDSEEERQWINLVILPPLVVTQPWDTDADHQLTLLNLVRDVEDERQGTNFIILPPPPTASPLDTDAFQQIFQSIFPKNFDEYQPGTPIIPTFESWEPFHEPTFSIFLQVPKYQDWTQEANFLFFSLRRCFAISAGLLTPQVREILSKFLAQTQVTAASLIPQARVLLAKLTDVPRAEVMAGRLFPQAVVLGGGIYV